MITKNGDESLLLSSRKRDQQNLGKRKLESSGL